jgi:cytochrome c oxidase subunit 4
VPLYVGIWAALGVLTVVTFLVSRVELSRPMHLGVALLIAAVKSALVVLFFMHLAYHRGANRLVFATAIVFVALLIGLTVADNATRFPLANPPRRETEHLMPPVANPPRSYPNTEDKLPDAPGPGFR